MAVQSYLYKNIENATVKVFTSDWIFVGAFVLFRGSAQGRPVTDNINNRVIDNLAADDKRVIQNPPPLIVISVYFFSITLAKQMKKIKFFLNRLDA